MFVEQIINNNFTNLQIRPWSQTVIIPRKRIIKEPSEYLLFIMTLNDRIIKKLKFSYESNINPSQNSY